MTNNSTVQHSDLPLERWVKDLQPNEDMALLYIIMENRSYDFNYKIKVDGKYWGEIGSDSFIAAILPAGKHILHYEFFWPKSNKTLEVIGDCPIILLPGETQYRSFGRRDFMHLTEDDGRKSINHSKLSAKNALMYTLQKFENINKRHQTERANSASAEPTLYLDVVASSSLNNTNLEGLLALARRFEKESPDIGIRVDYGSVSGRSRFSVKQEEADACFYSALDIERQLKEDYGGYPQGSDYRPIKEDKIFYENINSERLINSGIGLFGGMPFSPTAVEHLSTVV